MGQHYDELTNEFIADTFLEYLEWGLVWKDTKLPLPQTEWEKRAVKDSPDGEIKWRRVRKVPFMLERNILRIVNECNRDDVEIFLKVKKKLKGRQAKVKHWVEVTHLSYKEIARRLRVSEEDVKEIYGRVK